MKLLYCPFCGDMFNLDFQAKSCKCGSTVGKYDSNINAAYTGGIPFCISNPSFKHGVARQKVIDRTDPEKFEGERIDAWICPANSKTFRKDDSRWSNTKEDPSLSAP